MSEIRIGLRFEPEASDRAKVIKEFLTDNKIDVVEVENSYEAIEKYLETELLLLEVRPKSVVAMTRKVGVLLFNQSQFPPGALVHVFGENRPYTIEEIYSDTSRRNAFLIEFSGNYWKCLLLLELLSLTTFFQYADQTPFATNCLSGIREYIKELLIGENWDEAIRILSQVSRFVPVEVINLDLPEKAAYQIRDAIFRPLDPNSLKVTKSLLDFAMAAEVLPEYLREKADKKLIEVQNYINNQWAFRERLSEATEASKAGDFGTAFGILSDIERLASDFPLEMAHIQFQISEVKDIVRLREIYHKADRLIAEGSPFEALNFLRYTDIDSRNLEVKLELRDKYTHLQIAALLQVTEVGIIRGQMDAAQSYLNDLIGVLSDADWMREKPNFERFNTYREVVDSLHSALNVAQELGELKNQGRAKEGIILLTNMVGVPLTPNIHYWVQDELSQLQAENPIVRDKVQFTLFSPSKVRKTVRYSLVVYVHRPEMLAEIQVDAKKFIPEMGEHPPKQRTLPEPIEIAPKAEITIVPECDGIEFEPKPFPTKIWDGDTLRYNLDFKVPEGFKEAEAWIRISVQIKGFEIASLKTSCEVLVATAEAVPASVPLPDNPLIEAKKLAGLNQAVATPYRNIFVSYSHKDQPVALRCAKLIEQMLGSKVFIDVNSLRTGNDWKLEIAKAIDEADVFELLWSEHTAASEFCQYEWDYALKTKCPDTRCVDVIRPIYWQEPLTPPPPDLEHLQFGFVDLSDLIGKENAE